MNRFGDWSDAEFTAKMLPSKGKRPTIPPKLVEQFVPRATNDTPNSWDWRDKHVVTPVKGKFILL